MMMIGPWRITKRRGHRTACELFDAVSQTPSQGGDEDKKASGEDVMVTLKIERGDRDTHILMNEAMVRRVKRSTLLSLYLDLVLHVAVDFICA